MIELFVQSRYRVGRARLRKRAHAFLKKVGLNPDAYLISIAIIGDRKMSALHKKYANKSGTTPVFAFPYIHSGYENKYNAGWVSTDSARENATLLGEIVISYPQTLIFAADENKLVDDKLSEFIEHGLTNLLTAK